MPQDDSPPVKKSLSKKVVPTVSVVVVVIAVALLSIFFVNRNTSEKDALVYGDDVIDMYYFHLITCKYCHQQNAFMDSVLTNLYPQLRINAYELSEPGSREKLKELAKYHSEIDMNKVATPTTIIGDEVNIGFSGDETTGQRLIDMVEKERVRIDRIWNAATMTRTKDLRNNEETDN